MTIAKSFAVGKFEVTVAQYLACVADKACPAPEWQEAGNKYNVKTGSEGHYKKLDAALTGKDNPIVGVSWYEAKTEIVRSAVRAYLARPTIVLSTA